MLFKGFVFIGFSVSVITIGFLGRSNISYISSTFSKDALGVAAILIFFAVMNLSAFSPCLPLNLSFFFLRDKFRHFLGLDSFLISFCSNGIFDPVGIDFFRSCYNSVNFCNASSSTSSPSTRKEAFCVSFKYSVKSVALLALHLRLQGNSM